MVCSVPGTNCIGNELLNWQNMIAPFVVATETLPFEKIMKKCRKNDFGDRIFETLHFNEQST